MRTLILIIVMLATLGAARGQDTPPPCSDEALIALREKISSFLAGLPDRDAPLSDIRGWQKDVRETQETPDCAEAVESAGLQNQIVNNALIIKLAALAGETELEQEYVGLSEEALGRLRQLAGETVGTDSTVSTESGAIQILSFAVTPREVDRGDTVTLTWEVVGTDEVSIYLYHPLQRFPGSETVNASEPLPARGSTTYTIPDLPITEISFSPIWGEEAASVIVRCPFTFFVNTDTNACPIAAAVDLPAAYQPFERGFMIWQSGTVWTFDDGGHGVRFPDRWKEGESVAQGDPAPTGLQYPERGFGKVWTDNTFIRDRLGWATGAEQGYTTRFQATQTSWNTFDAYFTLPDGRIIAIQMGFDSYAWTILPS